MRLWSDVTGRSRVILIPPMNRRLFNLAAAVSLLMMVAVVALWVRSYWICDGLTQVWSEKYCLAVLTSRGRAHFSWAAREQANTPVSPYRVIRFSTPADEYDGPILPFAHDSPPDNPGHVMVPHWLAAICFAIVAAYWFLNSRSRRNRRRKLGLCVRCGYDLRATPDRCPECGTASTSSGQAAASESQRAQRQRAGGVA
jgi:hypothetical protein